MSPSTRWEAYWSAIRGLSEEELEVLIKLAELLRRQKNGLSQLSQKGASHTIREGKM